MRREVSWQARAASEDSVLLKQFKLRDGSLFFPLDIVCQCRPKDCSSYVSTLRETSQAKSQPTKNSKVQRKKELGWVSYNASELLYQTPLRLALLWGLLLYYTKIFLT